MTYLTTSTMIPLYVNKTARKDVQMVGWCNWRTQSRCRFESGSNRYNYGLK